MGKSGNHRKENTYKFQPFSERIANVKIDVIHRIKHYDDKPEEQSTYFGEAFKRWSELNCTEDFGNFQKEISNQIKTFAQLVHHEDEVVAALKKHLQVPNSLAMDALLDLVAQLARDLQSDFYKHFKDFFNILVNCLNVSLQNIELLEGIFSCLAFLFKFLWRYLVKDIQDVFSYTSLLLDSKNKWYVKNFAAESFAYLMRKIKDPSSLFDFMFSILETEPHKAEGIGRLMFEMIKGVMKQFHSCTQQLLPVLISKLGPVQGSDRLPLPWAEVVTALSSTMISICDYTTKENATVVWNTMLLVLEELHSLYKGAKRTAKKTIFATISRLLQLMLILLQHKNGRIVSNPNRVAQTYISVLKTTDFPEAKDTSPLDVTSALLLSCNLQLSIENTAKLTSLVFENNFSCSAVCDFTKSLFNLPCFEKDVLPPFLNFCHCTVLVGTAKKKEYILQIVTELILCKCPLPTDASSVENYNTYLLDFSAALKSKKMKSDFPHFIANILEKSNDECFTKEHDIAKLWCSLVCLPHVRPLSEKEKVVIKIQNLMQRIDSVVEKQTTDLRDKLLFLSFQCVYCLVLLQENDELFDWISIEMVEQLLVTYSSSIHALRIGDLYFTLAGNAEKEDILSVEKFNEIFPSLISNLSSSDSQVRLLTLRILSQFELPLPVFENMESSQVGVFKICLEAERIPASVHDYRRKLIYLHKLEYTSVQSQLPEGNFSQVPLRYLIGMLFCNLNLLWKPVNELIVSHAVGLNGNEFWDVYGQQLLLAAEKSVVTLQKPSSKVRQTSILNRSVKNEEEEEENVDIANVLDTNYEAMVTTEVKPDFVTFRVQLWNCMQSFAGQCESKSRILSPLLMRFLSEEYFPADLMVAQSQNICHTDSSVDHTNDKEDTEISDTEEESNEKKPKVQRKAASKSLLAHLQLFTLFKNPNSVYMAPKLKELYFDLLMHKENNIQKVAFECLMTYNFSFLVPYRENFERLMDDKTFKNELVLFNVNHEQSIISNDHRQDLLPVLMRILYGKLQIKGGKNTSIKKMATFRKSIIFRFLTGCSKEELHTFVELVFSPCRDLLTDEPHQKILEIKNSVDLHHVFPLKRIQGVLNTIGILCDKMGYLLEYFLPSLLQIIMGLLSTVVACLKHREQVLPVVRNTLKTLRQLGITRIIQFFEEFEKYEFSKKEIDAVFEAAVWPQLCRLPTEGLISPTPLLKLLNMWAMNRRYVSLLAKHHPDDQSVSPLPYVFKLLACKDISARVASMIVGMVECLLSQPDEEEEISGNVEMLDISDMIAIDIPSTPNESEMLAIPFTAGLVIPHVPEVLAYVKTSLESLKHRLKKHTTSPEIHILSMIGIYITDSSQCSNLVSLLLPFLAKDVCRSPEMEIDILSSLTNLLKVTTDCQKFFRSISKLFSSIHDRKSRSLLCDNFKIISEGQKTLEQTAELITQMNSWDKKRVEEPDYLSRLAAFKSINLCIQEMSVINLDLILPVIHNCCYFILNVDDMSLRDSSTHCINVIIKQLKLLVVPQHFFKQLVSDTILDFAKVGLKSKSQSIRHDCISILASVAENFPKHPQCQDLAAIQDKDVEADFYENMKHIQIHNRTRALRRLIRYLSNHEMKEKSLLSYFLPLSTVFITDISFKKRSDLIDAAIDAVGAICKQLTWKQYHKQLKHFLKLLSKKYDLQKILVRVIVSILDAFHFDLTCSTFKLNYAANKKVKNSEDFKKDENTSPTTEKEMDVVESKHPNEKLIKLATHIHRVITKKLLPELHRCITRKVKSDSEHKLVKSKYAEDDEILRVPIAIAMVRLLQHLPQKSLELNLPGILIKVCNFLKSRSIDIREVARETLVKIMVSLGARYFPYLLLEMRGLLKRGYQLHVLCFTVHTVLNKLSPVLKPGDLNSCIGSLTEVLNEELFGQVAEEKEVKEIGILEAKVSKSYDTYGILARYIGPSALLLLIQPLKQILDTTHSQKTARKVQEVMRKVAPGLLENTSLTIETLMIFIHGLTNEALPSLKDKVKKKKEEEIIDPRCQPPSCYLLSKELPRGGEKPKASKKTNSHVLVEFGLQLLHLCLKKSLLVAKEDSHIKLLDPFVPTLSECLSSKHIKINTFCLRCLCWILKFPLPALHKHIKNIGSGMFVLLKNYASAGAAKGDNFELISMCFKAVTVMIRSAKFHRIEEEQLHVLLTYCEEDIHDHHRQSTAFNLLKAILSRKLNVSQLKELIAKVENMSVTSESPHIRLQCRQVVLQYMLDYPLGKRLKNHIEFYLSQLSYEIDTGRESALEMFATMFSSFPLDILTEYSALFFIPMSMALVNDDSSRCRKLTALAIKSLLEKLQHKNLAAQVTGLFIEVEAGKFERHLPTLLPILEKELDPMKYDKEDAREMVQHDLDHLLFNLLNTLIKLLRECQIIRALKFSESMAVILEHVRTHMLYPHNWVRLASAQVFGMLLGTYTAEELSSMATQKQTEKKEYLSINTIEKIRSLIHNSVMQLQSTYLDNELSNQIVKNLVFLAKVVKNVSQSLDKEDESGEDESRQVKLSWMVFKVIREANYEAINHPKVTLRRAAVFKWIAAVSMDLGSELLPSLLHIILPPLQRETSESSKESELRTLGLEVIEMLKKIVDMETFTRIYSNIYKMRSDRRETRKRKRAEDAVSHPDIAAKRRIRKNISKKETRKRKISEMRPSKNVKRLKNLKKSKK